MRAFALALLHIGLATWCVYHALLYKRDPRSAMGWILASVFIPFFGPIAYFLFGINRVRSRARILKSGLFSIDYELGEHREYVQAPIGKPLHNAGYRVTGYVATENNAVKPFFSGDVAYPRMIKAIDDAQHRVLLATYILKNDHAGDNFFEALSNAHKRGVEVKVLIDGIGQRYAPRGIVKRLKKKGIDVALFLPTSLIPLNVNINLRNHRKLLIIDDEIAYAGGMNISDEHTTNDDGAKAITDTHFELIGRVVDDLGGVFRHDWLFVTGNTIAHLPQPKFDQSLTHRCRVIPDGPDEQLDTLALTIQAVVSAANKSIDIVTPYFLPNREQVAAFQSAANRGVRVRVILPVENNLIYVHWANRNLLAELLKWDVEVYYQPPPFCHSKLLIIDDDYCLIGSANLDPRSLRLNFELGVEVLCATLNEQLTQHTDSLVAQSHQLTYKELANRSIAVRLRDSFAALFSPYL